MSHVIDYDVRTLPRQLKDDRLTNSAVSTRDNGNLVLQ
jgi:hypothetical protein